MSIRSLQNSNQQSEALILRHNAVTLSQAIKASGKLMIAIPGGVKCCQPEEILFIKAESNYTEIYFLNGDKLFISKTLKSLEDDLPSNIFFRVHRSFVVNCQHIQHIHVNTRECHIILTGNLEIPVSRNKRQIL